MNTSVWIAACLRHRWRGLLVAAAGTAAAAAILAGGLVTGTSLQGSLAAITARRLGRVKSAVETPGRLIDAGLADALSAATGATVAPVLVAAGLLTWPGSDGLIAADGVTVLGVDERFFSLAAAYPDRIPAAAGGRLNSALALRVRASAPATGGVGGVPLLRVTRPPDTPVGMPLGADADDPLAIPAGLEKIVPDTAMGLFRLETTQIPPDNAFTERRWMAERLGFAAGANLLLSDAPTEVMQAAVAQVLRPEHLGLIVEPVQAAGNGPIIGRKVSSRRIFLDHAFVAGLAMAEPAVVPSLYHLVDGFSATGTFGRVETPYGFVAALGARSGRAWNPVPPGMADDEVVLTAWLAETLGVSTGSSVAVTWRRHEPGRGLVAAAAEFRVAAVLPMEEVAAEREWMPRFPGLSDVESCSDWSIGLPMDEAKLADPANEAYWKRHGPTPKAFFTLAAGRRHFGTAFGDTMVCRLPATGDAGAVSDALSSVAPAAVGLHVRPLAREAADSMAQTTDFRQLFLGMSLFLLAAALLLAGLGAGLAARAAAAETATLKACGMSGRRVLFLWMAVQAAPLLAGATLGALAGVAYAGSLVAALNRGWAAAVAAMPLQMIVRPSDLVIGGGSAFVAALLVAAAAVMRQTRQPPMQVLKGHATDAPGPADRWMRTCGLAGVPAALLAVVLTAAGNRPEAASGALFFGGGAAVLVALLCLSQVLAALWAGLGGRNRVADSAVKAGLLSALRNPRRSLLVMLPLAVGIFLSLGILAMQHDPSEHLERTGSGGGGYGWMFESAAGRSMDEARRAVSSLLDGGSYAAMRAIGDDRADCLNMSRAQRPRLLGVPSGDLQRRGAFCESGQDRIWRKLLERPADGSLPALAGDATTLQYGLAARTGTNKEAAYIYPGRDGRSVTVRVVGSLPVRTGVLQGSLLIDEHAFVEAFGETGYRLLLAEGRLVRPDRTTDVPTAQPGWQIVPVAFRLRSLATVESAYLRMFLVLGGLGMALGVLAAGLAVARSLLTRRRELAMLRAAGLTGPALRRYVLVEHAFLTGTGLLAGTLAAWVAVQPAVRRLGAEAPLAALILLPLGMAAAGALAMLAAVRIVLRAAPMAALREE